jgi:hypothetical protein
MDRVRRTGDAAKGTLPSEVDEPADGCELTPLANASPALLRVLESAGRLQELVPDAVLVGGSAAALYAGHRDSYDHDHVVRNLADRFDAVLDALESEDGWVTNRVTPGKIILGLLGEIETGVRQMIRRTPLETTQIDLPSGQTLTVPTDDETLRIKAFLIVRRNQTRDYLDVAALAERVGIESAASVLRDMDRYYTDQRGAGDGVATQVFRQLSDPRPKDSSTTRELTRYKNLDSRWHEWSAVVATCRDVAAEMEKIKP